MANLSHLAIVLLEVLAPENKINKESIFLMDFVYSVY